MSHHKSGSPSIQTTSNSLSFIKKLRRTWRDDDALKVFENLEQKMAQSEEKKSSEIISSTIWQIVIVIDNTYNDT